MTEAKDQRSWRKHLIDRKYLIDRSWTVERGGKHQVKMVKEGCRPITLPMHKGRQYSKGMNAALRRQAIDNDPAAPERSVRRGRSPDYD